MKIVNIRPHTQLSAKTVQILLSFCGHNVQLRSTCSQGRRLRGTAGDLPLKYLCGWDGGAFIPPQSLENAIANCHGEKN